MSRPTATTAGVQIAFDQLEPMLHEVTFVVVDLETTGTRTGTDEITEIGAVRVRGGEIQAELSTFVAISGRLPPQITRLTGIAPEDLIEAPSLGEVMATFLEFSRGAVLVAHNARFDLGFLRSAAAETGQQWPDPRTVCTLALARRVLHRGETRSHRLGELAAHLGAEVVPNHRALQDARATVDVLHALIARVGDCGVTTVSELLSYDGRLAPEVRRRAAMTEDLTSGPGVYVFRDGSGGALYVGSSGTVRRRARSYFSGGDKRARMRTMVGLAATVDSVPCAHLLEAWATEEQLIDALQPPYNRRSRRPRRGWWLAPPTGTASRPRISRTPDLPDCVGPFLRAEDARTVWQDLVDAAGAATATAAWEDMATGRDSTPLRTLIGRIELLAAEGAFERAARLRDRAAIFVRLLERQQQLVATATPAEITLVQAGPQGTWAVAVIRHGRLAASGTVSAGASPMPVIESVRAAATTIPRGAGPLAGATTAQIAAVHRWIDSTPTRIVSVDGDWLLGIDGAHALAEWAERAERAARGDGAPTDCGDQA